jgi:hypothetical protein
VCREGILAVDLGRTRVSILGSRRDFGGVGVSQAEEN